MIDVMLVDNNTVSVNELSLLINGGWVKSPNTNEYIPNDASAIKLCSDLLSGVENPVMIDIGANVGCFSLLAAVHKNMTCMSFEPIKMLCDVMVTNLAVNNLGSRVQLFKLGISDQDGSAVINRPLVLSLMGLTTMGIPHRFKHWIEEPIEVRKLDTFIESFQHGSKIQKIDIIKIDIEGCELKAIRGAVNTITKFKPHVICECTPKNTCQFGYKFEEIFNIMEKLGYDSRWISKDDVHFYPKDC